MNRYVLFFFCLFITLKYTTHVYMDIKKKPHTTNKTKTNHNTPTPSSLCV